MSEFLAIFAFFTTLAHTGCRQCWLRSQHDVTDSWETIYRCRRVSIGAEQISASLPGRKTRYSTAALRFDDRLTAVTPALNAGSIGGLESGCGRSGAIGAHP